MIALCPTMDAFGLRATSIGVSSEAEAVEVLVRKSLEHYLEPRLGLLIPEILSLRDDSGGKPVDFATINAAIEFAYCLPRFAPVPEVSADPDGEISFDWLSPSGEMFSVSVNKQNRLAYAGWFGEKSKIHGIEQLAESCPEEIVRGIQKATEREHRSERYRQRNVKALHQPY